MTVHKLHAGDGYTYLTRQTVPGDAPRNLKGQELADYYVNAGNPPGRWHGHGIDALGVDGQVHERQMKALFGEGLHPDADRLIQEAIDGGVEPEQAVKSARLGAKFRTYADGGEWYDRVQQEMLLRRQALGGGALTPAQRTDAREAVAAAIFKERNQRTARDQAELKAFIAKLATPAKQPVAGFDLVFSPAKSISLLWALGEDDTRKAVEEAHRAAWEYALAEVEKYAAVTRVGRNGIAQIDTHGLVAAVFDHRDSRAGDPDLHTHVAVSNKVKGVDGKWRSLDARVLYQMGVAASETYNARVQQEVMDRLPVQFTDRIKDAEKRAIREIDGIPAELIESFSSRRSDIEAAYAELIRQYRQQHGREPLRSTQLHLAQEATLVTRGRKGEGRTLQEQRQEWRAQAEHLLGADQLQLVLGSLSERTGAATTATISPDQLAADVVAEVARSRSTWTRWNVRAEVERRSHLLGGASREVTEALVEASVTAALQQHSIGIRAPERAVPAALQRHLGSSVFTVEGAMRYTSTGVLEAEARLVAAARQPGPVPVAGSTFEAARQRELERTGIEFTPEQIAFAKALACEGAALAVGIGPAGSSKTTSTRLFAAAWRANGGRVFAMAPSAAAAKILGAEIGARAETVHKALVDLETGWLSDLRPGDALVVDEAGMAGTFQLDQLVQHAQQRGAAVRLIGDPSQLSAVEAGGALRLIAEENGAAHLRQLYRFAAEGEGAATLDVRAGQVKALDFYRKEDRVAGGTRMTMIDGLYDSWRQDIDAGRTSFMLANSRDDVQALSARARVDRIAAGLVEQDGVELHNGSIAGRGDTIVTRQNDRTISCNRGRDFVKNGDLWTVKERNQDGSLEAQHIRHGGTVVIPADYVASRVELGYASTISRAQGATVDTVHALVDTDLTREQLYVAISRGRNANKMYVVTDAYLDIDAHHPPAPEHLPYEVLASVIRRDGTEKSATQTIRDTLSSAASLSTIVPQYEYGLTTAYTVDLEAAVRDALPAQRAEEVIEDDAWPALAEALVEAAGVGLAPAVALASIDGWRDMEGAESQAKVLHHRLYRLIDERAKLTHSPDDSALPWIARMPRSGMIEDPELVSWLRDGASAIAERTRQLAETAAAERPEWMRPFGACPEDGAGREAWLHRVGVAAAYRDQYGVTSDDALGRPPQEATVKQKRAHALAAAAIDGGPVRVGAAAAPRRSAQLRAQVDADLDVDQTSLDEDRLTPEGGRQLGL